MSQVHSQLAEQLAEQLSPKWRILLADLLGDSRFLELSAGLQAERQAATVYPPEGHVFAAFEQTDPRAKRVVELKS